MFANSMKKSLDDILEKEAQRKRDEERQLQKEKELKEPSCDNCGGQGHSWVSCPRPPNPNRPPKR